MSEFLEVVSPNALKQLQEVNAELLKTIASVKDVNANMIGIKTPSGSDSAIKKLTADYDAQRVTIQKLQQQLNALATTQQRVTSTAINQRNATRENTVAQQILRAETDRNVRANTLLGGAYAKASAQLLILKKQAKDYAIALGEAHPKTLQAVKDANDLGGRIMSADKVVGDFQRNVGNYSSGLVKGFQSVFSSVRQLAYILPGIGIAGIFSLALDPLFEFIKGMDLFKTKINDLKLSKEQLNETNKQAITTSTQELISLQGNLKIAKDINLSYKERMIAVKNLQESYPFYFENLTTEQILAGQTAEAEKALTKAILSRAKANAAVGKITENQAKIIDLEEKILELNAKLSRTEAQASRDQQRALKGNEAAAMSNLQSSSRILSVKKDIKNIENDINALTVTNNRLTKYSLENQEKAIGLDYKKEKTNKTKKEKIHLDFQEVKSELELRKAILERQQAQQKDNSEDVTKEFEDRIKARKEYYKISAELLNLNTQEEQAVLALKYRDDLAKNQLALKNKELTEAEFQKNISDIQKRYDNEKQTADVVFSSKWKLLTDSELKYYKDIQTKKLGYSQDVQDLILKSQKDSQKEVADDEKKILAIRQEAFLKYIALAKEELNIDRERKLLLAGTAEERAKINAEYSDAIDRLDKSANKTSPFSKAEEDFNKYLKSLSSGFIEQGLDNIGLSALKMFTTIEENGQSTFQNLLDKAKLTGDEFAVVFQSVGDVAQDVFNKIFEMSNANFQNEYDNLQKQKEVALLFAGESETAKAEIEKQAEDRRRSIAKREFQAKKQQAIFNIAIDTGQALVAQLAATPLPFGTGFLAIIAALGAAQIAMVASQKIPQYYKGTDNAEGGLAWTQEKGAEIITDKYGKIKSTGSDKGAQLTMLAKGDKVFTAEKSAMMFDEGLNSILSNNGISMPKIEINTDTKIIADKLDNLTSTIANKESFKTVKDARGYRIYQRKQAEEKQLLNNVLTYKGFNV